MSTRRRKLGATCALLALAATAPSGPSAQDLPVYSAAVTCTDGSASIPENKTLVTQLTCTETGLLRDLPADYIRTVAGNGTQGWSGDGGPAADATLNSPQGVVVDGWGNVYIADSYNHLIRRVDAATGIITTIAGLGVPGFGGDGGPATEALLFEPRRLALDAGGHLFFTDFGNRRIRRIDAATGIITTVVGGGTTLDDGVAATDAGGFFNLEGLAFDAAGDLFLVDSGRIRRVTRGEDGLVTGAPDEIITTVAGTGAPGFSGDGGPALGAQFGSPADLAFDVQGNLYIADTLNYRIRRVAAGSDGLVGGADDEIVTTVAGGGELTGDGIPATAAFLFLTVGVTLDRFGNIFVSALLPHTLRRVDAVTGIISTVVGGGEELGEDIPAETARLLNYRALDTDAEGNLFVAELGAHRIRAVRLAPRFTYEIVKFPSHGIATVTSGGQLSYQPQPDFVGDDTITFRARDSVGRTSPPATLVITVTAVPDADVAVSATAFPVSGVSADGTITYTVTVTNHGPAEATGVALSDTLPDGINLNYVTLAPSQGTCAQNQSVVTCDLGAISDDAAAFVSKIVHPLDTVSKTNTVSVVADQIDPDTVNNVTSVSSTLTSVVLTDLRVTQTDSPDPVVAGTPLTYRLTVTNIQNSCASNVLVNDTLPPQGIDLVSVTPSQGTCTGLQCSLGTLCPGQSASVTIVVTPSAAGTLVNSATVQDRPSDPAGNNTATSVTKVAPSTVVLNVAESIKVSDSVRLLPAVLIIIAEKIVVSDTPVVVPPVVIKISEAVRVGDAVMVIPPVVIRVSESLRVSDGVTLRPSVFIMVTERVTVSDSPTVIR